MQVLTLMLWVAVQLACGSSTATLPTYGLNSTNVLADEIHDKMLKLIERSRFESAETLIDLALKENPHDHQAQLLRQALASGLTRAGHREEGERQLEKIVAYLVAYPQESQPLLKYLSRILLNLSWIRQNIEPRASQTLERAAALLRDAVNNNPNNVAWSAGLSTVVNFQARGLLNELRFNDVQHLYESELARLRQRWRMHPENPDAWLRLAWYLKTAAEPIHPDYEEFARVLLIERDNLLASGVEEFPDSADLVNEYFSNRIEQTTALENIDADRAIAMLEQAQLDFGRIFAAGGSLKPVLNMKLQIARKLQQLTRQRVRQQLIGQKPPALPDVGWIHSSFTGWSDTPDTTTVLVFFSVAKPGSAAELIVCSDTIKSRFPNTRLVAITHGFQQSFSRMAIAKREMPADLAHQQMVYRQQLDDGFVKANNFAFAIGIANNAAEMADALGVEELPYILVVDAKGICRNVIVGADQAQSLIKALVELGDPSAKPLKVQFDEVQVDKLGATKNVHRAGDLFFAGQFNPDDLEEIKDRNVIRIITLRTDGEINWDEKQAVEKAGIDFVEVPFATPETLTDEVFDQIRKLLREEAGTTLFHCGSANRVGGVWLPYRVLDEGVELSVAVAEAERIGLRTEFIRQKALDYIRRQREQDATVDDDPARQPSAETGINDR